MQLIECVPNFSEGVNMDVIRQITNEIKSVKGIKLLNVDSGKGANRTVVTFAGEPASVIDAAFLAIKKAGELIDMSRQKGEHPRIGATDVCPLIPLSNISMEETVEYARRLAIRVGEKLDIPVYLYENAQTDKSRSNLSVIRTGEYEGFFDKIKLPEWQPDYGPAEFDAKRGATVIGARDFLIAYNVNLDTDSVPIANSIAADVRESGRTLRVDGEVVMGDDGKPNTAPGSLKAVKAIGWFIKEYSKAQVSMNLTNTAVTPLHRAFEAVKAAAIARGTKVTGSELIGLIPLKVLVDAGKFFLLKQMRPAVVSEKELIKTAVEALGLSELSPFIPEERIIEYLLDANQNQFKI